MSVLYPLVTFVVVCYNQEEFIRAAIVGAFAQCYPNLEILISDDFSQDRTFEIVQQMVRAYAGPHKVSCARNPRNLGIAGHINKVSRLALGELIIIAAGDDISVPERSSKLVTEYLKSGKAANYFYSSAREIALDGSKQGIVISPGADCARSKLSAALSPFPLAVGATQAWTKLLTASFAPLGPDVWAEDQVLGFRGILLGEIRFIDEPLVYYRVGSGISTKKRAFSFRRYYQGRLDGVHIYWQRCIDAWHREHFVLAFVLAAKIALLTVTIPVAPFLSVFRKLTRL